MLKDPASSERISWSETAPTAQAVSVGVVLLLVSGLASPVLFAQAGLPEETCLGPPPESVCAQTNNLLYSQSAKLTAEDSAAEDVLGISVALDGDRALVGAYRDDAPENGQGSAYVFEYEGTTWRQTAKLTAADGAELDYFGRTVALDGDRALIGAYHDDAPNGDEGSAYVFEYDGTTWRQTAKLTADDASKFDYLGLSVALDGDRALVGAPDDDVSEDDGFDDEEGSAYMFEYNGTAWKQTAKLIADDPSRYDGFGRSVALDADRALIGASRVGPDSVYVFEFNGSTWSQTANLTAKDGAEHNRFGESVALVGNRALIGAPRNDAPEHNQGSAYVFEFRDATWTQTAKLTADNGSEDDYFGRSVALAGNPLVGNRAVIGAFRHDAPHSDEGAAYVFESVGVKWSQTAKLTADDSAPGDFFGWSVSLDGDRALIGAPNDDVPTNDEGSAYVFEWLG